MKYSALPPAQGLYDPAYEHDACGMGFVAHLKGQKSNQIVRQALKILTHMEHRGACGCEENTGDGAGIMMQIPHQFLSKECEKLGFSLPAEGEYAVGFTFLPRVIADRKVCEYIVNRIIREEGQQLLGWRDVPVNPAPIGKSALDCMPFTRMVFVGKSDDLATGLDFERKLYVIRKRIVSEILIPETPGSIYFTSFSSRTLVYKGMLTTEQVEEFYTDLSDPSLETAIAMVHSRFSTNTFPSWERAHPNRYLIHNGNQHPAWQPQLDECAQATIKTDVFGTDVHNVYPIIRPDGSDSACLDNSLEFMYLSGYSLPHAMMMMIPEPWSNHESMSPEKRRFISITAT
ncbi:MAG: hypothetical protein R3E89_17855 [Thiolinea sp.]